MIRLSRDNESRAARAGCPGNHGRRGITLLFVVSMIVLFLLMGTTFVIVANDFHRSSRQRNEKSRFEVDPQPIIENTFYQILRGPELDNVDSPLRGHSLLEDMYGYGFTGTIATASEDSSGHFITITIGSGARSVIDNSPYTPSPIPGNMSGLVLSVVDGPAKGLTTRIVDHQVTGTAGAYTHQLVVKPHWMDNRFSVTDAAAIIGWKFVVNGRPFAGTGAGHFTRTSLDTPALSNEALAPNQSGIAWGDVIGGTGSPGYFSLSNNSGAVVANPRGPNEPYDTFDFQNMFLAGIEPDGTVIEPSFHRQTLVDNSPFPVRADFRAFARGGINDDGVVVDNNGDGKEEGIWLDIGAPVQTAPNGTCYKPLVSITILDMDSRVNLNAHGNRSHIIPGGDLAAGTIPTLSPVLNKGMGMGPAEINLEIALPAGATSGFLLGNGAEPGRYGFDGRPGFANVRDVWSEYKLFGFPDAPFSGLQPGTVGGHFGSAMDMFGRIGFAYPNITDVRDNATPIGLPMGNMATSLLPSEIIDTPYEMNFSDDAFYGPIAGQADALFTPRELEAVLRRYDPDSRLLPQRLINLGGGAFSGLANHRVTTSSFEVPTVHENLLSRLFQLLTTSNSGSELIGLPDSTTNREQAIRDALAEMLPHEFRRGLPMNVNRPFGDGLDNNGNGIIDEFAERDLITHPDGSVLPFDHDNDGAATADINTVLARANFARNLYIVVLLVAERVDRNGDGMITLADDWYDFNDDGTIDQQDRIAFRRVVAQWAVNVVDFRDADSILTPFEADLNPFNGWDVDSNITTEESVIEDGEEMRYVFWGAERPELLITETQASHDVRTQDLAIESAVAPDTPDNVPVDSDFDSHLVPHPFVFFELYNPWVVNDANQIRPAEFYDGAPRNGVDIQKMSLDGSTPVWRLVVTEIDDPATAEDETEFDPDDSINNPGGRVQNHVRRIYFKRPQFDSGPEVYYPDDDIVAAPLAPGRYAVVGSAGVKVGDKYNTYVGRRTGADALDATLLANETRRISLNPMTNELEIVSRATIGANWQVSTREITVLPIGLNDGGWERDLGVSDPLFGYFNLTDPSNGFPINLENVADGWKFTEDTTTGTAIDYAFDEPVDKTANPAHFDAFLKSTGLKPGYRVVHLQRLANPTRRFDRLTNPYRTIDSSALDLFVFNGAESGSDPENTSPGEMRFGTSERSAEQNNDTAEVSADRHRILFRNDKNGYVSGMARGVNDFGGVDEHVFSRNLVESLGRLNTAYQDAGTADQRPFASLQWNNRPFASQLELANVPFCSTFQLTGRFSTGDISRNVYEPDPSIVPETGAISVSGHFAHLLNFYADEVDTESTGPSLHRIFSFLEVPSRYTGVESFVNPSTFMDQPHGLSFGLAAPFDRISNYRYPGKINLNTVTDESVWNALMGNYASQVSFDRWAAARAGNHPVTNFGNPYRPSHVANIVPSGDASIPTSQSLVKDPVDVGLFRRRVNASGTSADEPLFDYESTGSPGPSGTDGNRSAYFKYDMRQRLGNLVTGRSSVFGVWITVGFFETLPDGTLRLEGNSEGIEYGVDAGEARRGRGFYMVDRSIPVAFEPGKNHNVDRAVLIKSIIE